MRNWIGSLVATAALLTWTPAACADTEGEDGDRRTARVSAVEGHLYARGPFDEDASELVTNAVLRAGDEVFTDEESYAEIELAGATFLRLAPGTSVVLEHVDEQGVEVALADGALYVSNGKEGAPVRLATFAGVVQSSRESMVRAGNDAEHTHLFLSVARGDAELVHDDASRVVDAGQTLTWTKGAADRETFDASRGDDFDRWNAERERIVRGYARHAQLPASVVGAHDLDGNGTWMYVENRWAWRPTVVASGWRPYSNGYWDWCDPYGWNWVSYDPWGYTTCHYGRWHWAVNVGWCWYPDRHWSSAWVVFAVFGGHVGWAPCDFYGRPACGSAHYSHYDRHSWSYCGSDYFHHGGGYRRCDARPVHRTPPVCSPYRGGHRGRGWGGGHGLYEPATGPTGGTQIRQFDGDPTREFTPVPVHDVRRDLAPPRRIRAGADRRDVVAGNPGRERAPTLLDRSVRDPGSVRQEPWNRTRFRDVTRSTDPAGGYEPGQVAADPRATTPRAQDGWTPRARGEASAPRARLDTTPRVGSPASPDIVTPTDTPEGAPPADPATPRAGWTRPRTRGATNAPRAQVDTTPRAEPPSDVTSPAAPDSAPPQDPAAPRAGWTRPQTRGEASAPRTRPDMTPRAEPPATREVAPPADATSPRVGWSSPRTRGEANAPRTRPEMTPRAEPPPRSDVAPSSDATSQRDGWMRPQTRGEASAPPASESPRVPREWPRQAPTTAQPTPQPRSSPPATQAPRVDAPSQSAGAAPRAEARPDQATPAAPARQAPSTPARVEQRSSERREPAARTDRRQGDRTGRDARNPGK